MDENCKKKPFIDCEKEMKNLKELLESRSQVNEGNTNNESTENKEMVVQIRSSQYNKNVTHLDEE